MITQTLYILLPVHNRIKTTQKFIDCLQKQTFQNYHLILIDDGSTDNTSQYVQSQIKKLNIIQGNGNWWWGGSLHQGYLFLKKQTIPENDIVLIINDDTEFKKDFLETALTILETSPQTILASECYSQQTQQLIDAGTHYDWTKKTLEITTDQSKINCLATKAIFLRWGDFLKIGGLHPYLLPHHAADFEFTIRAYRKGFKLMTDPRLKLWLNEETTGHYKLPKSQGLSAIRQLFSKKSALNPLTLTLFIILSCPWRWKLSNLLTVWKISFISILYLLLPNNHYLQSLAKPLK